MNQITLKVVNYAEHSAEIQLVRIQVFQVEQGVDPALEFDGKDEIAEHILAYVNERPVGTTRIRYLDRQTVKIERLAVLAAARGQGIGKQLMVKALEVAADNKMKEVIVHAQEYVKGFYQQLGFEQVGEGFAEAGIGHVKMRKQFR
ncbi:MAG TPA: GNAT family N-acetyltransferase [Cyanobacteria bacterium UBA8803]|nr:GNAT family N-acetyltransferase [Cyanobacteria bacterium UBA9273]HBL57768.1 GNAT family N-acetyltransferase [Cyanobacteria bacterium UBA8803]